MSTLRGAGHRATILDARGAACAVLVQSNAVEISDLAIVGAAESGLLVQRATGVRVARVALRSCLSGLLSEGASGLRVENAIITGNRRGVVISAGSATTVVNCTVADNTVLALSAAAGRDLTVFNNVFSGSPTGVSISSGLPGLALDANLYATRIIGVHPGEPARATLFSWRRLSGCDAHSIDLAVTFSDAAAGDYRPVSRLPWDPKPGHDRGVGSG